MGCADGVNRRRYHAWLIGAQTPPVGRVAGLATIADAITVEQPGLGVIRRGLTDCRFAEWDGHIGSTPTRCAYDGVSVSWRYAPMPGVGVERRLFLYEGRNAAAVTYRVSSERGCTLELRPLAAMRDFHELTRGRDRAWRFEAVEQHDTLTCRSGDLTLHLRGEGLSSRGGAEWWWNFEYTSDLARGQDGREDLYCPGLLAAALPAGTREITLYAWMDDGPPARDVEAAIQAKQRRLRSLSGAALVGLTRAGDAEREIVRDAAIASDLFVVARDVGREGDRRRHTSVIAGYPWFSDWGRDTMISVPGLLLATGRLDEAVSALTAFAGLRRHGLIPNCFDNATGTAEYNTADASLWFLHACAALAERGGDRRAVVEDLLPACEDIIRAYQNGTDYDIRVDPHDHLLAAGNSSTQLTWMDAARDGVVFTPRYGKPVEINALWITGLRRIARVMGEGRQAAALTAEADAAAASFAARFWNDADGCLFDTLVPEGSGWRGVPEIRPNQVFAVSLADSPLPKDRQAEVVATVKRRLLTPFGLRTLDPAHPSYRPRYEGNLFERDGAYHNGTVWPYLLGPYAEAVMRVGGFSPESRREAREALASLADALRGSGRGAIGSIAEIYDAEERPGEGRRPEGCPAQAWSVAELLRVYALSCS